MEDYSSTLTTPWPLPFFTFLTHNGTFGQINFDGKLLQDLDGEFEKVNRLAVVSVQEDENQLLCIKKAKDATGKMEADAVKEAIDNWGL